MKAVALVMAYNSQGQLLLGKRNDNERWTLPGGHVEQGEAPHAAALRELHEESGLQAVTLSPLTVHTNSDGLVLHVFTAFVRGEPHSKLDPDNEVERWKFHDVADGLPKSVWDNLHGPDNEDLDPNIIKLVCKLKPSASDMKKAEEEWALRKDEADDDEVMRLLKHPDPNEKAMALRLDSVTPSHLIHAFDHIPQADYNIILNHKKFTPEVAEAFFRRPGHLRHKYDFLDGDYDRDDNPAQKETRSKPDIWRILHNDLITNAEEYGKMYGKYGYDSYSARGRLMRMLCENENVPADTVDALLGGSIPGADIGSLGKHPSVTKERIHGLMDKLETDPTGEKYHTYNGEVPIPDIVRSYLQNHPDPDPEVARRLYKYGQSLDAAGNNPGYHRSVILALSRAKSTPSDVITDIVRKLKVSKYTKDTRTKIARHVLESPNLTSEHIDDLLTHKDTETREQVFKPVNRSYDEDPVYSPALLPRHVEKIMKDAKRKNAKAALDVLAQAVTTPAMTKELHEKIRNEPAFAEKVAPIAAESVKDPEEFERYLNHPNPKIASSVIGNRHLFTAQHAGALIDRGLVAGRENIRNLMRRHRDTVLEDPNNIDKIFNSTAGDVDARAELVANLPRRYLKPEHIDRLVNEHPGTFDDDALEWENTSPQAVQTIVDRYTADPEKAKSGHYDHTLSRAAGHQHLSADSFEKIFALGRFNSKLIQNRGVTPENMRRFIDHPESYRYLGDIAENEGLDPETQKYLYEKAKAMPSQIPDPQLSWKRYTPFHAVVAGFLNNEKLSGDMLDHMVRNDTGTLDSSSWDRIVGHSNVQEGTLRHIFQHPNAPDRTKQKVKSHLEIHSPDEFLKEKVGVSHDMTKLRKLRDVILESGKNELRPKDIKLLGNWSSMKNIQMPNGNISADKIQALIDSQPKRTYNVGHTTYAYSGEWRGPLQGHSQEPSRVFQVHLTNEMVQRMKQEGVWDTFRKVHQASFSSNHPVGKTGIGWVRYTTDRPAMIPKYMSGAIDEMRYEMSNNPQYRTDFPNEADQRAHAELMNDFAQKHQVTSPDVPWVEVDNTHPAVQLAAKYSRTAKAWVRDPNKKPGIFIDEIQSDFGQSFIRQLAGNARGRAREEFDSREAPKHVREFERIHHGANVPIDRDELKAYVDGKFDEYAQKRIPELTADAQRQYPEEHYTKISEILFGGKHSNEVLGEAFLQHMRDTGQAGSEVHMHTENSKAYMSLGSPGEKLPGHFMVTYRDLPKKWGMEPAKYGELQTQTTPNTRYPHLTKMPVPPVKKQHSCNVCGTKYSKIDSTATPQEPGPAVTHKDVIRKMEEDFCLELFKAIDHNDLKPIAKQTTALARKTVNHKPHLDCAPPSQGHLIEAYQRNVLKSKEIKKPLDMALNGLTRKVVFEAPVSGQAAPSKFMVKPYHESWIKVLRDREGVKNIQGWAEMTHQALYHAGGIGHLHQEVHVAPHDMGPGKEEEPALVVHMRPGMHTVTSFKKNKKQFPINPDTKKALRQMVVMDFLTNNFDRHQDNLLCNEQGDLLAIDHSRAFQYQTTHGYMFRGMGAGQIRKLPYLEDRLFDYHNNAYVAQHDLDPFFDDSEPDVLMRGIKAAQDYQPVFDWWREAGPKIRDEFHKHLPAIKDRVARAHVGRNFDARCDWLDEIAQHGLEHYGPEWYAETARMYRTWEMTELEKQNMGLKKTQSDVEVLLSLKQKLQGIK